MASGTVFENRGRECPRLPSAMRSGRVRLFGVDRDSGRIDLGDDASEALGPLPLEPFRYYQYGHRTAHLDGCVEVASPLESEHAGPSAGVVSAALFCAAPRRRVNRTVLT